MSDSSPKYLIRDSQGNVYGPADEAMLRDWVQQGRIVPGMDVAPRETREWVEASKHPAIADLFASAHAAGSSLGASAQPAYPVEPTQTLAPSQPQTPMGYPNAAPATVTPRTPVTRPSSPVGTVTVTSPYPQSVIYPSSENPRVNPLTLVGFIFSITGLALALCPCALPLGALLGLAAIVLAGIGLYQIKLNPPRYTGPGLGIAAIVMGTLELLVAVCWFAYFLVQAARHP